MQPLPCCFELECILILALCFFHSPAIASCTCLLILVACMLFGAWFGHAGSGCFFLNMFCVFAMLLTWVHVLVCIRLAGSGSLFPSFCCFFRVCCASCQGVGRTLCGLHGMVVHAQYELGMFNLLLALDG